MIPEVLAASAMAMGRQRPASEAPCALGGCPNDGLGMVEKPGLAVPRRALAMAALDGPAHRIAPAVPAVPLMPERPPERRAVPTTAVRVYRERSVG